MTTEVVTSEATALEMAVSSENIAEPEKNLRGQQSGSLKRLQGLVGLENLFEVAVGFGTNKV